MTHSFAEFVTPALAAANRRVETPYAVRLAEPAITYRRVYVHL
jgi:hypothetical protein